MVKMKCVYLLNLKVLDTIRTGMLYSVRKYELNRRNEKENKAIDRTEVLRRVVADAESMGIRDRAKLEQLTNQVIERLEKPRTLPGMEYLVPGKTRKQPKAQPSDDEITAIVKEILSNEELAERYFGT